MMNKASESKNKIYAMPLLKNIGLQAMDRKGCNLLQCPVCNCKCFEMQQARVLKSLGYTGMCTECMLNHQFGTKGEDNAN